MTTTRPYTVDTLGGAMPTQATGTWIDGQRFYFRARHGRYTLEVHPTDPVNHGTTITEGTDPTNGTMTDCQVLAILDAAARTTRP